MENLLHGRPTKMWHDEEKLGFLNVREGENQGGEKKTLRSSVGGVGFLVFGVVGFFGCLGGEGSNPVTRHRKRNWELGKTNENADSGY